VRGHNHTYFLIAAVSAVAAVVLIGCGGGGSTTTASTTFPVTGTITSTGGSVTNGVATVTVPGGALSTPTTIAIQVATGYLSDTRLVANTVFSINGNGITFVQPVTISIVYTTANLPTGGVESSLALFKLVSNAWTQVTGSHVDTVNKIVTGADTSLGTYAVFATVINSTTTTPSTVSVMFTSNRPAAYTTPNLYTVNANATGLLQLTNLLQGQSVSSGFFKPDGTMIVYTLQISGGSYIDVMTPTGSGQTTLVGGDFKPNGLLTNNHNAEYSADGTKIVFASDRSGEDEIYTMNADGSSVTALTQNFPNGDQMGPVSFTRSGQIAFAYTYNGATTYFLVNADGTNLTQVAAGSLSLLAWWSYSPNGANIVYTQTTNATYDVYVATSSGASPTKITTLAATAIHKVRYSHDGTKILFDAAIGSANPDVYAVNPDGTGLLNLTNNTASDLFMDAH